MGAPTLWPERPTVVDVSDDGAFFVLGFTREPGQNTGLTVVFDSETGEELFRSTNLVPVAIGIDSLAKELFVGTEDRSLVTIDLLTGEVLSTFRTSATSDLKNVGVRQDGSIVVSSSDEVLIFDRRTGFTGERFAMSERLHVVLRPDGKLFTTDGNDNLLEVYELALNSGAGSLLAAQMALFGHGISNPTHRPASFGGAPARSLLDHMTKKQTRCGSPNQHDWSIWRWTQQSLLLKRARS